MNIIQTLLTEHIAIWTAADTEKKTGRGRSSGNAASVYGIRKLRELILELAVRGKLVPQDANDEPASALLKRIQAEKARLIAEGKIKKDKPLPPISDDEKPFEIPCGWEWTRVAHVGHDWGQKTPDSDFTYIEVSAIDSQRGIVSSPELVKPENVPSRARKVVKKGSVIYSTIRPYLLNIAVIEEDFLPEPIASTAFAVVHPFCLMPSRYFLCFFRSPVFVRYVESVQMGIAYPAINDGQFFSGLIPLPPIEEQHRIVAKVDELMALCDQLETRHNNAAEAHEKLVSHLLGTLTQSKSPLPPLCKRGAGGGVDWQRIAAHFDTLFTTEASIDALKQTLLQLAVMGKLIDSSGSKRVALSEVIELISGQHLLADEQNTESRGIPYLTGPSDFGDVYPIPSRWTETPKVIAQPGDILVTVKGAGVGKTNKLIAGPTAISRQLMAVRVIGANPDFIHLALKHAADHFQVSMTGIAIPGIGRNNVLTLEINLPPLPEQHRIVAKVDELMALCDQLKTRITLANQLQQKLADVVVERAIA